MYFQIKPSLLKRSVNSKTLPGQHFELLKYLEISHKNAIRMKFKDIFHPKVVPSFYVEILWRQED